MPQGRLDVTVLGAQDLKNTQTFGRQDPFFIVRVGSKHFTSQVASDAGKNPVWNARFSFDVTHEDRIYFTIRNRNVLTTDALLGEAEVNLAKVYAEGKHDAIAQVVTGSGQIKGSLSVILLFSPYGGGKASGQSSKANKHQQQTQMGGYQHPAPVDMGYQPHAYQAPPPAAPYSAFPQPTAPSAPPMYAPQHQAPASGYTQQPPAGYPSGQQHGGYQQPVGYTSNQQPGSFPMGQQQHSGGYSTGQYQQPPAGYPTGQQPVGYASNQQPGSFPIGQPQAPDVYPIGQPTPPAGYPTGQQTYSHSSTGYAPAQPTYQPAPMSHPQSYGGGYGRPSGYSAAPHGGLPPAGYPKPPKHSTGYGQGGYYGGAVAAPTGMYYSSHHAGKHKKGKKRRKKFRKRWFK